MTEQMNDRHRKAKTYLFPFFDTGCKYHWGLYIFKLAYTDRLTIISIQGNDCKYICSLYSSVDSGIILV
jgi:hypothetical protein